MVNKAELLDEIVSKVSELDAQIKANKDEDKSIGRLRRKARALRVVGSLIATFVEDDEFTFDMEDEMLQMLECKKGKKIVFNIKEGDDILQKMDEYENVKDVYKRIMAQADKMGLKLVGSTLVKK